MRPLGLVLLAVVLLCCLPRPLGTIDVPLQDQTLSCRVPSHALRDDPEAANVCDDPPFSAIVRGTQKNLQWLEPEEARIAFPFWD